MDYKAILMRGLRLCPASWRRALKAGYERLPGFGRKIYFAAYGEDAFLQGYFRQKLHLSSPTEMHLSEYLRAACAPGFYVDVGAHHPTLYSNTLWFYQRDWRGINIDAAPGSIKAFDRARSRDINLELLISDREDEIEFMHWETARSVNTVTPEHARRFAGLIGAEPKRTTMRASRLETVLSDHLPAEQTIDFMTVDVEGHDLQVLMSNDWNRFRPELVLVESHQFDITKPLENPVYVYMLSVGYEAYAWLRPTLVFRQVGLRDWLGLPSDND